MGRVFVVGSLNIDHVVAVERHPRPGETVAGGDVRTYFGGKGANQAVAACRAFDSGAGRVVLIGRVGDDAAGAGYRERLAALGVDVASLRSTGEASTGAAMIAVGADGENAIIVSAGANARLQPDDLDALESLDAGDVVLATLEVPLPVVVAASERAARAGARFILNLSPFAEVDSEPVRRADPLIVNEHEASSLAAASIELPSLLVTKGAAGSQWGDVFVPAERDVTVVDTTGAGDAYCGTLAARLAMGESPEAAMRAATTAAAAAVARVGAQ